MSVRAGRTWVALLLAVAMIAGSQAWAEAMDGGAVQDTGRTVGRAGFAYLGGLRVFAAAVLWNRLEPQFHEYYGGVALQDQTYLLPTMRLVTRLDPSFTRSYDVAAWILHRNDKTRQAIGLLEEGTRLNPRSAGLHSSLAQMLFVRGDLKKAVVEADRAMASEWADEGEEFIGYASLRAIYVKAGVMWRIGPIDSEMDRLRRAGAAAGHEDDEHHSPGDGPGD